ncbi:MAG: chorismate mutase [Gemmatimonadaceae bacterium]
MSPDERDRSQAPGELSRCRSEISRVDGEIVNLLRERIELARQAARLKHEQGFPILDPAREAEVIRSAVALARNAGLAEEPVREIFWQILGLSRKAQQSGEA